MGRTERLNLILDILAEHGQIDVEQIVATLGVSSATARRDLDSLASQNLLNRTHGGAVGQTVAYDLPARYRGDANSAVKQAIAQVASDLVERYAIVGLSGGTTSTTIATALGARSDLMEPSPHPNLTIVTNAINIANQLVVRPQIKIVLTGGVVKSRSYELVGPYSQAVLEKITLDVAFIGVNGIDPVVGASVSDEEEASINSLMARRAKRAIVCADSTKVGRTTFATMGGSELFQTLITDDGITAAQADAFRDRGIEVLIAHTAAMM
jgi:DeoR family transcriptional regulator of aga operon